MRWNKRLRGMAGAGLLTLPLLLSGCSLFGLGSSARIDPPPQDVEAQMLQSIEPVNQTSIDTEEALTTVYLENDHGLLAPVSLHLPKGDASLKLNRMLDTLVKGGSYAGLIPAGFTGVLPEGTQVKAVTVKKDEKLAIVEFNKAFSGYDAKDERKILESIAWTLTGDPEVQNVQLWVEDEKLNEMPVNGTPLDRPLGRNLGINLELDKNPVLSQTAPVTVYFSAATPDGVQYYVPVTRFVPAGTDPLKSALAELIKGPAQGQGLERVLTDSAAVGEIKVSNDGIVTVSLQDDMFEAGDKPPAQMMQSVVLTVTENAKDAKVRIWLNGQKEVVGMDNQNYSEPVMRPETINEIPL